MSKSKTPEQKSRHAELERIRRARNPERYAAATKRWAANNPERAAEYSKRTRKKWRLDHPEKTAIGRRRYKMRRFGLTKEAEHRLKHRIDAAVPCSLPFDVRSDVIAMMFEAVYSGRFPLRISSEHVKSIISEHFRMFTKYGPVSLDAARFDDGRGSLHDMISEGMWA
jgi:hypothetical protein